ncbi:MAG: glycine zipper family protein [Pseudomonadota bacterium]|nr:glycine zipper family protein [Pseudomonadota bacterium]
MKSRIWQLAGVGLLCISVTAHSLADEPQGRGPDDGQRGDGRQGNQGPGGNNQPRPQNNEIIRGDNSRQFEQNGQPRDGGQWQNHQPGTGNQGQYNPPRDFNNPVRPPPPPPQLPANSLPIQPRPDAVNQTQEPKRGYYQDIPRRYDNNNQPWQNNGPRPDDRRWNGRPDGHGNGWGPGPQYRPGHVIDRFPDRDYRVPYRGQDYFYSGGYWYRPLGPRYVVVQPPRGIRVSYMPDYAREVWVGGTLLFLAAGSYYAYQENTQDYVVVEAPVRPQPQPASNGYDVVAYPANGQSAEQINQDGFECYQHAVQQSGFDPRTATYQPDPSVVQTYRQAQGDCLRGRGYQVTY